MKKYLCIFFSLLFMASGCNDWFDAPTQGTDVPEEQLFADEDSYLNALAGIYTLLRSNTLYGEQLSIGLPEFLAQHYVPDDALTRSLTEYRYDTPENRSTIRDIWREMYRAIATCNKTLEHIESTDIPFSRENQKKIITGELYALRGALHFELLRWFHPAPKADADFRGMPYMTEFSAESSAPRTTREILALAEADLQKGAALMNGTDPLFRNGKDYTGKPGKLNRELRTFHLNYYAVTALLARLYLYEGEYQKAYDYADSTREHLRRVEPAYQVFYFYSPGQYVDDKSLSREHIFGISSTADGLTRVSQELFEERRIPACSHFTSIYPSADDIRRRDWFVQDSQKPGRYIMSAKFSADSRLSGYVPGNDNSKQLPVRIPFIKLGEVSLIAAEALNESGKTEEAAEWLIELQSHRNIDIVKKWKESGQLTRDNLRREIRAEYERELFGEGQAFFMHKRLNDKELTKYDASSIEMQTENYTLPIPADGVSSGNL